jgi:mRNA deadenylase 3'-5' endonuclease subunit Ccr4
MYLPPLTDENLYIATWEYRRDLIRQRIATVDADVVCIQEVSPLSFDMDFAFMHELGYDGKEMFKRGRFRPATFYKRSRLELVIPAVHKDRTLLTVFRPISGATNDAASNWYVLNCHLQAGKQGSRRLRQMNEGLRAVMSSARKLKGTFLFIESLSPIVEMGFTLNLRSCFVK